MWAVAEDDVSGKRPHAVVDAEAGFVPGVEGEEDGILGEFGDGVGEEGAGCGRFYEAGVCCVVVD